MRHDDKTSHDWLSKQLDGKKPNEVLRYVINRVALAVVVGISAWTYFAVMFGWITIA